MVIVMKRTRACQMAAVRSISLAAISLAVAATQPARAIAAEPQASALSAQDLRLASISYRIATRNGDRCQNPERLTGLLLHDRAAYDEQERPLVAARHGLGEGFGVREVVAGSAADRAGIRRGDEIVELNGAAMAGFEPGLIRRKASYDRSEAFETLLDRALRQGPATLLLRRGEARIALPLTADLGCGGRPVVMPAKDFNAWSDGQYVAITSRLMRDIPDDGELAFVVAHEMSHNILRHREQLHGRSALLAQFGFGSGRMKDTEIEADTLAVRLLARAGYDLEAPARFLTQAARKRPFDVPITHPGLKRRIGIVTAEIARLQVYPSKAPTIASSRAVLRGETASAAGGGMPSLDFAAAPAARAAD